MIGDYKGVILVLKGLRRILLRDYTMMAIGDQG